MTTHNHTAIATGAAANASTFNTPMGQLDEKMGNVAGALTTTAKTSLVAAVNELDAEIGTLSSLTTTDKSPLVDAINEIDGDVGDISTLTTTDNTDLVAAVNELDAEIGDISVFGSLGSDVSTAIEQLDDNVGSPASLTTSTQTSMAAAINELHGEHGNLAILNTSDKDNFVDAINEVYGRTADKVPQNLTAASTVALTSYKSIYRVSGSATINTINTISVGSIGGMYVIYFINKATELPYWKLGTSGNIEISAEYTPAENEAICLVYNSTDTTWHMVKGG